MANIEPPEDRSLENIVQEEDNENLNDIPPANELVVKENDLQAQLKAVLEEGERSRRLIMEQGAELKAEQAQIKAVLEKGERSRRLIMEQGAELKAELREKLQAEHKRNKYYIILISFIVILVGIILVQYTGGQQLELKELRDYVKLIKEYSSPLPTSCQEIETKQPNSLSDNYLLANGVTVYCHMDELCGSGGGWTRLAYLNMSDATENCPPGFKLYQSEGVRACGRRYSYDRHCQSVQFLSNGISYSQVCGRVVGYQYGDTRAIHSSAKGLDSCYTDGISITRGSPRQHVWTLMAGYSQNSSSHTGSCPCNNGSTQQVPWFIGNHYYCESANPSSTHGVSIKLYTSDPLWDGKHCTDTEAPCCTSPNLPWFHRDYGNTTSTTDYLELRVCADGKTANLPFLFYEIYVK